MKNFLIVFSFLYLLIGQTCFAQSVRFVKVYTSVEDDIPRGFITCNTGCSILFALGSKMVNGSLGWFLYDINTNGDTTLIDTINTLFNSDINIINRTNKSVLLRALQKETLPNQISIFGDTRLIKYNHKNKYLFWERINRNNAISKSGYYGFRVTGFYETTYGTFKMVNTRYQYPNVFDAPHPFIQEFDTSGNLVNETDFLNALNEDRLANSSSKQVNGDFVFSVEKRMGIVSNYLAQWIDGSTHTVYKSKLIPISFQNNTASKYLKIEVIKPGDKYLIYAKGLSLNQVNGQDVIEEHTYLTDSSLSLQNALWIKPGNAFTFAQALDDGNILGITNTLGGAMVEKFNTNSGQLIWQRHLPHNYQIPSFCNTSTFDIDDSGSLFLAGNVGWNPLNKSDIWLAKLANVGQPWDPWNTNPQGLANENKPLSLHAYPNPTSSRFKLRGYKEEEGLTLRLFNNSGKEVWRGVPSAEGEVDISTLSPGLYHVEALTTSGKRWSTRVVRE